jgi:hypothetical protein
MSIIGAVRTYIAQYTELETNAPVWVGFLGSKPIEYSIVPLTGNRIVESYLNGGSLREFPFAFQSMEYTADDLERLENASFYEAFAEWLETQSAAGTLPTLDAGKQPVSIEATNWGFLYEQGVSDTGIYQINCKLVYEQS